jgi:hypothetical protein
MSLEQQPVSVERGTAGRRQSLVPRPHCIDDMDTPLTFKLQYGGENRQGKEARFQIGDFRFRTMHLCEKRTHPCRSGAGFIGEESACCRQ